MVVAMLTRPVLQQLPAAQRHAQVLQRYANSLHQAGVLEQARGLLEQTWPELAISPRKPGVAGAVPGRHEDAGPGAPQQCGAGAPGAMQVAIPDSGRMQLTGRQAAELVAARGAEPRRPHRSRQVTRGEDPLVEEAQRQQVQRDLDVGRLEDPGISR